MGFMARQLFNSLHVQRSFSFRFDFSLILRHRKAILFECGEVETMVCDACAVVTVVRVGATVVRAFVTVVRVGATSCVRNLARTSLAD